MRCRFYFPLEYCRDHQEGLCRDRTCTFQHEKFLLVCRDYTLFSRCNDQRCLKKHILKKDLTKEQCDDLCIDYKSPKSRVVAKPTVVSPKSFNFQTPLNLNTIFAVPPGGIDSTFYDFLYKNGLSDLYHTFVNCGVKYEDLFYFERQTLIDMGISINYINKLNHSIPWATNTIDPDVFRFLRLSGLAELGKIFDDMNITSDRLVTLTREDMLLSLGMTDAQINKFFNHAYLLSR